MILNIMWAVTEISIAVYVVIAWKMHSCCSEETQKASNKIGSD